MSKGTAWGFTSTTDRVADWRKKAACRGADGDIFFPLGIETEGDLATAVAKSFCRDRCPLEIRQECLNWALENKIDDGVWGATTPRERRILLGRPAGKRASQRRQAAPEMLMPVRCANCRQVYDAGKVEVTARYIDCSTWTTPCCGVTADDRSPDRVVAA